MTATSEDTVTIDDLLREKRDAARELQKRHSDVQSIEEKLQLAQLEREEAYEHAIKVGWSASDLRKLGFSRAKITTSPKRKNKKNAETVEAHEHAEGE